MGSLGVQWLHLKTDDGSGCHNKYTNNKSIISGDEVIFKQKKKDISTAKCNAKMWE